jgi:hypothetical protein
MKRLSLGLYLLLAAAWLGVAWAEERTTSGTSDEPALLGSYITGPFSVEEVALQGFSKEDVCGNTGTWIMNLRPAGWSLDNYPLPGCIAWNPPVVGSWRLSENNVIAIRELEDLGCSPEEYAYAWKLEGDMLTLNVVNDPCTVRIYVFTAHSWRKIPEGAQPVFR